MLRPSHCFRFIFPYLESVQTVVLCRFRLHCSSGLSTRPLGPAFAYILHIYLLTPWSRVLLEKLTVNFAASQEIPRVYGTRKSLTVPTSARHLSLSCANSIQSPRPPPTS